VRTVQGDIEAALGRLFARPVATACAGRTDAGVHALGQVVTTDQGLDGIDLTKLRGALNGMCGPSIAFAGCREAPEGFHARFSARSRAYVYAVLQGDVPDPWLARTTLYHPGALDIDAMNEAAGHLVGKHDFSSFGRVREPDATAERTLFELRCGRRDRLLSIRARADSFIQQMVRSLTGTLLEVGQGRRSPDDIPETLRARDRAAAGAVAPPHGLCLVAVEYDEGWSRPPAMSPSAV
jgi:tRNA pseudouridine38-40 synthase